jgi:hypothetical protein
MWYLLKFYSSCTPWTREHSARRSAMHAGQPSPVSALADDVRSLASLRVFLLASASTRTIYHFHQLTGPRSSGGLLQSNLASPGESEPVKLVRMSPVSACRREYNKTVGRSLHESAAAAPAFSAAAGATRHALDPHAKGDDLLLERRLRQIQARSASVREHAKQLESTY